MILKMELDYMNGPIWKDTFDVELGEMCTGIDIIDSNEEIMLLNDNIQEMYDSLFEFNTNEEAVFFNDKKAAFIKEELLGKYEKLLLLIDRVNGGAFEVVDNITEEVSKW